MHAAAPGWHSAASCRTAYSPIAGTAGELISRRMPGEAMIGRIPGAVTMCCIPGAVIMRSICGSRITR